MQKLKILFLGAGYANISALKSIRAEYFDKAEITLVSKHNYHYHTVLLHTIAAWGESVKNVKFPLEKILDSKIKFLQDNVVELREDSVMLEQNGELKGYDYIVSGLGFSSESFGIKGISDFTLNIHSYESALKIHEKIKQNILRYKTSSDENDLKIIVCGGGLTGVEFASELALSAKEIAESNAIDSKKIKIYIIEAMPSILPMYSKALVAKAYKRLESLGVEVKNNAKILECFENGIKIAESSGENTLNANNIIWTAGVKGNEIIAKSNFKNGRSKVEVGANMKNIENLYPKYFFIGDNSCLKDAQGAFYPPTAQLSVQEGVALAGNIMNLIDGKNIESSFEFIPKASFCSLGRGYAIGYIYNFHFSGKIASFIKHFIESRWVKTILK
ncbi:FAD-dependent oxidoreductase [Helicobacter saguini]|nr:FAD-dependent oxidoreductase [Helicobacter saguini]MWV62955.1 FAD-dependent oxidoreductase [Helicobacter saguini]MWV66374.1 FAD-dependent oxidoreductase [Helicobacter saguini]MWV68727.1 FAD-dependent oxidoreductase [Helicobacter saguini]MWV71721.1 FAD-dependent oxidoreductase [Helicobacter saguini]